MSNTNPPAEKPSDPLLVEFNYVRLLNADLTSMTDEELRTIVRKFQSARSSPHTLRSERKTAGKKAMGTHVNPLEGLL